MCDRKCGALGALRMAAGTVNRAGGSSSGGEGSSLRGSVGSLKRQGWVHVRGATRLLLALSLGLAAAATPLSDALAAKK